MKLFKRQDNSQLPKKYDGVIEAIRMTPDGNLQSARIYERRGPTWSDRLIISRYEMIQRLNAGQIFVVGERKPFMASTFELKSEVHLLCGNGSQVLVSGSNQTDRDSIEAPRF